MHLKRIRLYGFKSFSQDSTIEFEPGITALVGPNGGGKSNIVDAVRWALGEQRLKDLRAERWEDLLHQGGTTSPAARLAEVALEFDNQDGEMPHWPESLTVTRRYYRSGDSEYLINGQTARLKDVTDLFLDSGLGRFSYAIISQGRVEGALLQKPLDRLEQLQEAAGVSRYKVRKRETLTHLKETEDKLIRLTDLGDEVGREMEDVRERADAEARYRTWEHLRQDWQQRVIYTEYYRALQKQIRLEQQLSRVREERQAITEELGQLLTRANGLRQELEKVSRLAEDDAQESGQLLRQETALRLKKTEAAARVAQLAHERQSLEEGLQWISRQRDTLQSEGGGPALSHEKSALPAEVLALRQQFDALTGELKDLRTRQQASRDRGQALAEERTRLNEQLAEVRGLLSRSGAGDDPVQALAVLRQRADQSRDEVSRLTGDVAHATEERTRLSQFLKKLEQEIYGLKHQLSGRQARVRALRQLDAEGEGLNQGVRAILRAQHEGTLQGVLGTLGSVIDSEPDLALAVETALAGAYQDVVMESEARTRDAVRHLKAGSLGRATFFPFYTVRSARVPSEEYRRWGREPGVVGWAAELVRCADLVRPAVQHVLGRVLIVQSLDDATQLGKSHSFRYKMVTLDGQVVHAGGAITGGSRQSERRSPRSRKVEIDELTRRIREDSEVVAAKEELFHSSRGERDEVEKKLDAARELLAERRHGWMELRQILEAGDNLSDPRELLQQLSRLRAAGDELQTLLMGFNAEEQSLTERVNALAGELRLQESQWREREIVFVRIQQELGRLNEQEEAQQTRLAALDADMAEMEGQLRQVGAALESLSGERVRREEAGASARARIKELRDQLLELENRQRVMEVQDRKLEQRGHTWDQERIEIAVRFENYTAPENAEPLDRTAEENARREIQRITASLNEMGSVVPGSLALFEQLRERHTFLTRERGDVEEARGELLDTLREIDGEMERRVKETAAQVESAFADACRQLYGGGDGGFTWVDGDNGGIDLWVRPVGKRPSHLALLSGGEKALGGIAWLFSLLAVHPSPFVVLDEVEASLDEANAVRFAQYIRGARQTAQYVIVTHQRETMEAADALWGVAGDGHGRSRLVSVRLTDAESQTIV